MGWGMAGDIGGGWSQWIALGVTIVGGIFGAARLLTSVDTKIADVKTAQAERNLEVDERRAERLAEVDARLITLERECVELITQAERRYGETAAAVRQKIVDHELWSERNHVNKETFFHAISGIQSDVKSLSSRMDEGFNRIYAKLDRAAEWRSHLHKGEPE